MRDSFGKTSIEKQKGIKMTNSLSKTLIWVSSIISIGFGAWHFFVPTAWKWYSYIDPKATELIVAIRAINFFFSLTLVLFGIITIAFILGDRANQYSLTIILGATSILWFSRVIMQIAYPQGSMNRQLQYGLLITFILVFLCNVVALIIVNSYKRNG
jgi:hypothetical protein